jgi:hypothetical protein
MIHVKQYFSCCYGADARDSRETPHSRLGYCALLFHVKQDDMDGLLGIMIVGFNDKI